MRALTSGSPGWMRSELSKAAALIRRRPASVIQGQKQSFVPQIAGRGREALADPAKGETPQRLRPTATV